MSRHCAGVAVADSTGLLSPAAAWQSHPVSTVTIVSPLSFGSGVRSPSGLQQPAQQQPDWPDPGRVEQVTAELAALPPLVFAGECDLLRERLAAVTRGEAFVLQGGDCAETFAGATADAVRAKLQTILQMAVVLTYGASVPVVKIGRLAGQFAKPRSRPTEVRDGVELPAYRGDAINGFEFTAAGAGARPGPDAARLPLLRGHAEPVPGVHHRRLRRPASGARLEPGLRPAAARPASATSGWPARSTGRCRSCGPAAPTRTSCGRWSSTPATRPCCCPTSRR